MYVKPIIPLHIGPITGLLYLLKVLRALIIKKCFVDFSISMFISEYIIILDVTLYVSKVVRNTSITHD